MSLRSAMEPHRRTVSAPEYAARGPSSDGRCAVPLAEVAFPSLGAAIADGVVVTSSDD